MSEYTDEQLRAAQMRWFGLSRVEIANKLKVPESTVQSWMRSAWWQEASLEAARLGHDKMVSKARRVLHDIMDKALDPEAPTPIVKEAAATARWYLERRDPDMKGTATSAEDQALSKVAKMLDSLTREELAALAQEPVVLGFPTNEPDNQPTPGPTQTSGQAKTSA